MPFPQENAYGHTRKLKYILQELEALQQRLGRPIRVLDFGCGNGEDVSRHIIEKGYDYCGVDMHSPSLEYAISHFACGHAEFFSAVPEGKTFDAIVYADVLEHLDEPLQLLLQHWQLLAPQGVMIASLPNGYGPFENEKRLESLPGFAKGLALLGCIKRFILRQQADYSAPLERPPYNFESGHVQFFTKRALLKLISKAGFQLQNFAHGSVFCGPLSDRLFIRFRGAIEPNVRFGAKLPYWAVSTWYFTARKVV